MDIKDFFKKILYGRLIIGILLGAIAGFAYYYFIGCNSGSCAITSSPVNSTVYGTLIGGVLTFKQKKDETESQKERA